MALIIKKQTNGIYYLEGSINTNTSYYLRSHLMRIIHQDREVTINIDKVNLIDEDGLAVLKEFYFKSLSIYNTAFFIVGFGCKEIYDDFRISQIAS